MSGTALIAGSSGIAGSALATLLAAQGWHDGFRRGEVAVLLAAWCAPLLALAPWPWVHPSVLTVAALAALFVMLLRRAGAAQAAALS